MNTQNSRDDALTSVEMPANRFTPTNDAEALTAADKLAIIELASRLNWCLDTRNYDQIGDLFTEDGVFDWHEGYGEGRQNIIEVFQKIDKMNHGVRHQSVNHVVTANTDGTVMMVCYLMVARTAIVEGIKKENMSRGTPYLSGHGIQTFQLRRTQNRWKIARSTLEQVAAVDAPDAESRAQAAATAESRHATA